MHSFATTKIYCAFYDVSVGSCWSESAMKNRRTFTVCRLRIAADTLYFGLFIHAMYPWVPL